MSACLWSASSGPQSQMVGESGQQQMAKAPTVLVSNTANQHRMVPSAGRCNCNAAATLDPTREPPSSRSTRLLAPLRHDRAVGRAVPTPAATAVAAGSEEIPRPKHPRFG